MKGMQAKGLFCCSSPMALPLNGRTSKRFLGMSLLVCVDGVLCFCFLLVCRWSEGGVYVLAIFSRVSLLWPLSSNKLMMNSILLCRSSLELHRRCALQSSP